MPFKARFKSIFNGVVDIVSLIDTNYNILMVNTAYQDFIKKSPDECIGQKCYKIIKNRKSPCSDCPILINSNDIDSEAVIKIGDDKVLIRRHPVYDQHGEIVGIFEIGRLITKQLKMEQAIEHQGRLKILGEFVAAIVHEIKNPLAGLGLMTVSLSERIKQVENIKPEIFRDMDDMINEIKRLEKLLGNLTNFSKPGVLISRDNDIHHPIENALKVLKNKFSTCGIKIVRDFDLKIPSLKIDVSKMQQVFLNILLNSIEAMPEGGEIRIKTSIKEVVTIDLNKNHLVEIMIEDKGKGIKKKDLHHVFEPFFSKSFRKTGLGLSIVYKIIELHKGRIEIKSKVGKGTTVIITLPAHS